MPYSDRRQLNTPKAFFRKMFVVVIGLLPPAHLWSFTFNTNFIDIVTNFCDVPIIELTMPYLLGSLKTNKNNFIPKTRISTPSSTFLRLEEHFVEKRAFSVVSSLSLPFRNLHFSLHVRRHLRALQKCYFSNKPHMFGKHRK